jgi:trigger factor
MQFEKVSSEGLQREYLLKFENQEIDEIVDRQIEEIRPTIKIKGFRPGRVPTGQLKKIYGQKISLDILGQKVSEFVSGIVKEDSLRLAATPLYNLISEDKDDFLRISVKMLLFPEITSLSPDQLKLERITLSEDDLKQLIDKNISFFLHGIAEFNDAPSSDVVIDGAKVRFKLKSTVDSEDYAPLTESYNLIIGAGQIVPEIEQHLLGLKTGEEKTFDLKLSTVNVPAQDRDKTASVIITVEEFFLAKPLDESDRTFKRMGFESLEHAKTVIADNTRNFYRQRSSFKLRQDYLKIITGHYEFDIPQTFMQQEIASIVRDDFEASKSQNKSETPEENQPLPEATEEQKIKARHQLTIGFVLLDYAQKNNITVEDWEVERHLQYHASQLGLGANSSEYAKAAGRVKAIYNNVKGTLFQDKVVDHILESLNISEKSVSREEFTNLVTNS